MSWHISRQFPEIIELKNNTVWPSSLERLHRPIPLLVEQIVSYESQESPSSEGLVTPSSADWPYEAMERGLARPAVRGRKLKAGKGFRKVDNLLAVP
jgi:hypothetical protein